MAVPFRESYGVDRGSTVDHRKAVPFRESYGNRLSNLDSKSERKAQPNGIVFKYIMILFIQTCF